jgi:hypothetical protein
MDAPIPPVAAAVTAEVSSAPAGVVAAGAWFGALVVSQWLIAHWWPSWGRARVLAFGYGACLIGVVITAALLAGASGRLLSVVFGSMTMSCLFVLYTPLYYVVATSLSVQSIILLRDCHGRLSRSDLYDTFAGRRLLDRRLESLARSGYVVTDGRAFRITSRGRRTAAPFLALKSLWRLGPGG